MLDKEHKFLSIRHQCQLLSVWRSNVYYKPVVEPDETTLANQIHALWLDDPAGGYRRITHALRRNNYVVNHKKILRIMREMRIKAFYPKRRTTVHNATHKKYPYLLANVSINHPNHVWATDITYIKLPGGFVYLVAIIDIYSRCILSWRLSNTMDTQFCIDALNDALKLATPEILNTDQGCQFTSEAWITLVQSHGIKVSMDGRGRWADNIYIERFWRTIKHEHIYLHLFENMLDLQQSIAKFMELYNHRRVHMNLCYQTPADVYYEEKAAPAVMIKRHSTQVAINDSSVSIIDSEEPIVRNTILSSQTLPGECSTQKGINIPINAAKQADSFAFLL